ncbi:MULTISPECIES: hypothetical protein [Heyndrickxia]|uniref:Uncharacterized protein n=1 Tax=Heyndrickxia oleronia TaxID=38875 RepID=A0A8E2I7W0_9BACI|nr:hypothetical protein [Heyndrickxia oleronia]NYV64917.1 hypothetical protein [Bacillus sp. Gen3]OJH19409.1 hypothetical protein BLX88_09505 [Bacillus obstructivus]MBU5210401.1 hypothetical protein [Heyndrickxia oleronia]MCI1590702.1 hypothetical protein [Heyndrickxia oleronia]MCI1612109.1 hypothetical protein [Heyndrickxia oleronia]
MEKNKDEHQIIKLERVTDRQIVNQYLDKGWTLLEVIIQNDGDEHSSYLLGWDKANGEINEYENGIDYF